MLGEVVKKMGYAKVLSFMKLFLHTVIFGENVIS